MDVILFLIFAIVAVACAVNLVVQRHPITSAISLVGVMASLAVLYLLLGAQFIAAAQLIVYAGAIMVLFVFVIMLLNAGAEKPSRKSLAVRLLGLPLFTLFLGMLGYITQRMGAGAPPVKFGNFARGGPYDVGKALFTEYLLPFEVTSVLILIAVLGAIVLARKEAD